MEGETKRYHITCPYCGRPLQACKSLGMEIGFMNIGMGTCLGCGKHFQLEFDFDSDKLTAKEFPHDESKGDCSQ